MSLRYFMRWQSIQVVMLLVVAFTQVLIPTVVFAGHAFGRNNSVGGVSIDPRGVVRQPSADARKVVLTQLRKDFKKSSAELTLPTQMRMVSLKGLAAACDDGLRNNLGQLPDEVKYMAGLQRIQYVFVYPEENDIVLAGPGEGWKVRDDSTVVGVTTDRPVLQLDDFIIALRYVQAARQVGISCSIDPTQEGIRNLQNLWDKQRRSGSRVNPKALEPAMKTAFGPQTVRIAGVPGNSHFARVLLAADYRMKRLAMDLDKAPIKGLPSYLDLLKGNRSAAAGTPRWWLACNYEPVAKSEDGLAWEIRGPGVKAMTEESFLAEGGQIQGKGRVNPAAKKWADMLTEKYDELCQVDGVFGELRNLMDMCVVAALIEHHNLWEKSGCQIPLLTSASSDLSVESWHEPKTVSPVCSFLRTRAGWLITASGGVQVESWQAAQTSKIDSAIQIRHEQAERKSEKSWWWN